MKLAETRFPAFWDIYEPIFLTLESVQKTCFLSLITIHDIANPKWFDSQWVFATYSIIIIQETARNNIKTNKSIISKQLMSAQLCKAARMTVEKQQKSTLGTSKKKKKKIQSLPGSVIPTINILDNTSDTTCVELALMLAWWRGACGTTIGCKTSIMQIRLNNILHSYYCSNVTWQSPLKTQSSTLKLLRIQAQVARNWGL